MLKIAPLLLIPLACIIIYSGTLNHPFHFDDYTDIVENQTIRSITNQDIWSASRPLAYLTFALNYSIHGLDVQGYHIFNIAMHTATSLLVWWLILLFFRTPQLKNHTTASYRKHIALFTALLFSVHPIQIQAVTYIVQRMAMMATFWYLLALCCYIQARLIKKQPIAQTLLFAATIGAGVCSLMTKQIGATLPFTILLFEYAFLGKAARLRKILLSIVAVYTVSATAILYKGGILWRTIKSQQGSPDGITSLEYMVTQIRVLVTYLRLLVFPIQQNLDYDYPINSNIFHIPTLLSSIFLGCLLFLAIKVWKSHRMVAVSIFWFFLTLAVESSIITLPNVIFEHRLYLPSFGILLGLIAIVFTAQKGQYWRWKSLLLVGIVIIMSLLTVQRNHVWSSELLLWQDIVNKSPGKARPWNNRGELYRKAGNLDKALADYSHAIDIYPAYPEARNNRGALYQFQGKYAQALADYDIAIKAGKGRRAELHFNRGLCFYMQRDYQSAKTDFHIALERRPRYTKALMNLGNVYVKLRKYNQARTYYNNILESGIVFDDVHFNIGISYFEEKKWKQAIVHFEETTQLNNKHANAYLLQGQCFFQIRNMENAQSSLSKAIELNPQLGTAWAYLGYVQLKLGQQQIARKNIEKAQKLGVIIHSDVLSKISKI